MLARFGRLRRDEFGLDDGRYAQLGTDVERWRAHALELGRRQGIDRNEGRDFGIDR